LFIMATDVQVDLLPTNLLNKDGAYALDHPEIAKLVDYLWTGILLDTKKIDYLRTIGIATLPDELNKPIDDLILQYIEIQGHCSTFKNVTFPLIVSIASQVHEYAILAGGKDDSSFYKIIIDAGEQLVALKKDPSKNEAAIKSLAQDIKDTVDYMVGYIAPLKKAAGDAKQALILFETICKTDQKNLESAQAPLRTRIEGIGGKGGELEMLQANLEEKRKELKDDQDAYDKDYVIAMTSLAYAWIWPIGTIAAAIVAGVYGAKAAEMEASISAVKDLITADNDKIALDNALVADMGLISKSIDTIIEAIGSAIQALGYLESGWQIIEDDLQSCATVTKNISFAAAPILRTRTAGAVITAWNGVATAVEKYRNKAYVSMTPTKINIDHLIEALKKNAETGHAA